MEKRREKRFREVVGRRQPHLTVILENVHDQHNIGAVLRTCDSVGIMEIYVLQSNPDYQSSNITLGKRTSAGSRKWVDTHLFHDTEKCMREVRRRYGRIYATHLDGQSQSLYQLDLARPVALLFGNERDGVSEAALALCDGNFIIPQVGFSQSLNISVACAVSLYEAYRQREAAGMYGENAPLGPGEQEALFENYLERHKNQTKNKKIWLDGKPPA